MDWAAMGLPTEGKVAERPRAGDIARQGVPTCRLRDRLGDVRERAEASGWNVCLVVDDMGVVLGRLRGTVLKKEPDAAGPGVGDGESVMKEGLTTIRPNTELGGVTRRM